MTIRSKSIIVGQWIEANGEEDEAHQRNLKTKASFTTRRRTGMVEILHAAPIPSSTPLSFTFKGMEKTSEFATDSLEKLNQLGAACPDSTMEERYRFLRARKGDVEAATIKLHSFLCWREECGLVDNEGCEFVQSTSDEECWRYAATKALKLTQSQKGEEKTKGEERYGMPLPRMARLDGEFNQTKNSMCMRDLEGRRILHVLPGQLDITHASAGTYALCTALYLDRSIDRKSTEFIAVVIDVRGGKGWANPSPFKVFPFIKAVAKLLSDHFPERMAYCVLFPMPRPAVAVWNMAKLFLDPRSVRKFQILNAPSDGRDATIPRSKMQKYFHDETIDAMERNRVQSFRL